MSFLAPTLDHDLDPDFHLWAPNMCTMHVKLSDQLMQFFEEVSKGAISDVER